MAITLFPLLVSNTVSKNIIPGVAKVLENYIIVYGLDSILAQLRTDVKSKANYRISNKKVIKREDVSFDVSNFLYNEMLDEQSQIYGATRPGRGKGRPQSKSGFSYVSGGDDTEEKSHAGEKGKLDAQRDYGRDPEEEAHAREKGKQAAMAAVQASDAAVRIDTINMDAMGLEPTWMKIDQIDKDGNKTSGIIGVKVIPYLVKSDASLASLLMYDRQVSKLQRLAIIKGRRFSTKLYNTWKRLWKVATFGMAGGKGGGTVSGDPRKDIILKRSIMNSKDIQSIFVLANQSELSDDFLSTAKGVVNLQKMGWGSLIVADDVNRRVAFCMRELKGLCSMMPYTMIYQTFSQAKVYEDIEDAKRTASSIFKVRRQKLSKLIGENIAENKNEDFGKQNLPLLESEFISEAEYIDENLGSFLKKITPSNLKTMFSNALKGKIKDIPSTTPEKVVKLASKLNPEFRKGYILAKRVLENSVQGVDKNLIDWAAIVIAIRSSLKKGGTVFIEEVKINIKKFIKMVREASKRSKKSEKPNLPKDHIVDATFGWVAIVFGAAAFAYLAWLVGYIGMHFGKFIFKVYKDYLAAHGITVTAVGQLIKDLGTGVIDATKDTLLPWMGLTLLSIIILRGLLKK